MKKVFRKNTLYITDSAMLIEIKDFFFKRGETTIWGYDDTFENDNEVSSGTHVCVSNYCHHDGIDASWDWGVRHYWYFWMMMLIFVLTVINNIIGVVNLVDKHYK